MPQYQRKRGLVAGALVALPLMLLSGLAFAWEITAPYASLALLALSIATAFVTACYVHAVDAILWSSFLSAFAIGVLFFLIFGIEHLMVMPHLVPWMFGAAVLGAILGLFVRPFVRKRLDG